MSFEERYLQESNKILDDLGYRNTDIPTTIEEIDAFRRKTIEQFQERVKKARKIVESRVLTIKDEQQAGAYLQALTDLFRELGL